MASCLFTFLTDLYFLLVNTNKKYLYFLYLGFSACHHYPLTNSKLYLKCVVSGGDAWTDIIAIYSADVDFMQIDVKSIAPVFDISC